MLREPSASASRRNNKRRLADHEAIHRHWCYLVVSDWPLLSSAASFDTSSLSVRVAKESMASKNHTMKQTVQTFMDETSTMPLPRIKHLPSQRTLSSQRKSWRKTRNVIHLCIHSKSSVSLLLIALVLVGSLTFTDAQSPAPVPTAAEATDAPIADSPATDAPVSGPETLAPSTAEPDAMEPPVSATPETQAPTVTPRPSGSILTYIPTVTLLPSGAPSFVPTALPTFRESIIAEARFRQKFLVGNGRIFNDNEIAIFETLYQGYTKSFAQNDDTKIMTTCVVDAQEGLDERRLLRKRNGFAGNGGMPWKSRPERRTQGDEIIEAVNMDYTMTYTSSHFNVSSYPILFQNWINVNLVTVTEQMRLLQLNVSEAQTASRLIIRTPAPTVSLAPSAAPTGRPTITPYPSYAPSNQPTTVATRTQPSRNDGVIIIVVSLVIGLSIVGIGLLIYFRKKRRKREIDAQTEKNKNGQGLEGPPGGGGWNGSAQGMHDAEYDGMESPENNYGSAFRKYADPSANQSAVLSPSESRASNQSLLSAGNSMGEDSADEADTTQIFADEFDQYKDQNLEKMRADIEGNLEGCDGMMNQAVARALIDEDDLNFGATDYLWGGDANVTGQEIEASALGDVMDWLKRNEKASVEEKRAFMQETLNRMVASVRHGVLGPSDASRAIHECAALLGLQLAADIPVTTVVISGLRKKAVAEDIRETFSAFGSVSTAAVAPNERGYGILRFKNNESVDRAMKKFQRQEVVVQDVAVQLKVVKPGAVEDDSTNGA